MSKTMRDALDHYDASMQGADSLDQDIANITSASLDPSEKIMKLRNLMKRAKYQSYENQMTLESAITDVESGNRPIGQRLSDAEAMYRHDDR